LRSDGPSWEHDLEALAGHAFGIVIDVSEQSSSMTTEVTIVQSLVDQTRVLYLMKEGRGSALPLAAPRRVVRYVESRAVTIAPKAMVFVGATGAWLGVSFWINVFVMANRTPLWLLGAIGIVLGWLATLALVPKKGFRRDSAQHVRSALHEMLST